MGADFLINLGVAGLMIGILAIIFVLYRRIRWIIRKLQRKRTGSPKIFKGVRNLVLLLLWLSIFGILMFGGFFMRAYHAFTMEQAIAEVRVEPAGSEQTSRITLTQFISSDSQTVYQFLIRGDQWMLEGDILKWDNWLNFMGWQTRYRLTRIRGRFIDTEQEISESPTIFSLVERENDPLWRYLYKYGTSLPFVSSVYGNAVFQTSGDSSAFLITISSSGFIAREMKL
jgi:hypothetical protein